MRANSRRHNYSIVSSGSLNLENVECKGKKQNLKSEKSFLDEIINIFHIFFNASFWYNIKKWWAQVLYICLLAIYNYTALSQKHSVVSFKVSFSMVMKLPSLTSFFAYNYLEQNMW